MIAGTHVSLLRGSRVTLGGNAHAGQLAAVVAFSDRCWCCQLLHPRFSNRQVWIAEEHLGVFEGFIALSVSLQVPAHLRLSSAGAAGQALYAATDVTVGQLLIDEAPFMVVRRSAGPRRIATGVPSWKLYFAAQQQHGPAIEAFDSLGGGEDLIPKYGDDARRIFRTFVDAQPSAERTAILASAKLCAQQERRIARVLGSWEANGHQFPARGIKQHVAAVYHLGTKLLHSCEPNCTRHISPETGRIEVRASRALQRDQLLTIDYTGGEAAALASLTARRAVLRKRGFECICDRCVREEQAAAEGEVATGHHATGPARSEALRTAWVFTDEVGEQLSQVLDMCQMLVRVRQPVTHQQPAPCPLPARCASRMYMNV